MEGLLLQVARASYINAALTPPACKFLNFFTSKIKLINFLNTYFSIFHLYLFPILFSISFTFLQLYFQTIHFLLPFSKPYYYSLITLILQLLLPYWRTTFSGFLKLTIAINYLFSFFDECTSIIINSSISFLFFLFVPICFFEFFK